MLAANKWLVVSFAKVLSFNKRLFKKKKKNQKPAALNPKESFSHDKLQYRYTV